MVKDCEGPGFWANGGSNLTCGSECTADRCVAGWLAQGHGSSITAGNGCIAAEMAAAGFGADKGGMVTIADDCEVGGTEAVGLTASEGSVLTAGKGMRLEECARAAVQAEDGGWCVSLMQRVQLPGLHLLAAVCLLPNFDCAGAGEGARAARGPGHLLFRLSAPLRSCLQAARCGWETAPW
jgi:hypothetical protein